MYARRRHPLVGRRGVQGVAICEHTRSRAEPPNSALFSISSILRTGAPRDSRATADTGMRNRAVTALAQIPGQKIHPVLWHIGSQRYFLYWNSGAVNHTSGRGCDEKTRALEAPDSQRAFVHSPIGDPANRCSGSQLVAMLCANGGKKLGEALASLPSRSPC